jgi:L-2-hydroxyglutarate oxidase LhgO
MVTQPSRPAPRPTGVIGAGLVGLAIARQLAQQGVQVIVFEKENEIASHQSGRNSGVVHAGIYYSPGSAKATMCRRGATLLKQYCADHGLPYEERGKLVIARDDSEIALLRELERRSIANDVPGLRWLEAGAIRELEPDVAGKAALLSPSTAITDYAAIARAYAADITAAGGRVLTGTPVTGVLRLGTGTRGTGTCGTGTRGTGTRGTGTRGTGARGGDGVEVDTPGGAHVLDRLVICAGLQSDLVASQAGDEPYPQIVPFRGEYLRLRPHARDRVRHLIYPVPDPAYPFLGVHLTPRIGGESDLGPNAVLALAREGYRWRQVSARQVAMLAGSQGFRRLARQHWRAGVREMRGSLWRRSFLAQARTYLPWLEPGDVVRAPAGIRAQAVDPDGTLVDDFRISRLGAVTAVRNAPSPAATASLAIAEHVVNELHYRSPQEGSSPCLSSILRFTSGARKLPTGRGSRAPGIESG